jgi:hypothetical protein
MREKGDTMRLIPALVMAGSLVLMAALPAAARSARSLNSNASVHDSASDRDTYAERARSEMQEWRRKLQDFGDSAHAKAKEANKVAVDDLNKAWTRTEAASRRLENAGTDDWRSAKASYKADSHRLTLAWDKVSPTGK